MLNETLKPKLPYEFMTSTRVTKAHATRRLIIGIRVDGGKERLEQV